MSIMGRLKSLLTGVKPNEIKGETLEIMANEIMIEVNDVITEFKKLDKQWTFKIWSAWKVYQPLFKQIIELVKEVGDTFTLSNEQKKTLATIVCWKIIEPLLPNYAKLPIINSIIKKGINKAIEVIYSKLKIGEIKSETFIVGSVR